MCDTRQLPGLICPVLPCLLDSLAHGGFDHPIKHIEKYDAEDDEQHNGVEPGWVHRSNVPGIAVIPAVLPTSDRRSTLPPRAGQPMYEHYPV